MKRRSFVGALPGVLILAGVFVLGVTWTALAQKPEQGSELGTFTTFNFTGAGYTTARYLNSRGEIVGFYFEGVAFASPAHGFLRSTDGELTSIDFPGTNGSTIAFGINSEDNVVGSYSSGGTQHGFLRTGGGEFFSLDFPDATSTSASDINPRGDIVGAYTASGKTHGYVRDKDGHFSSFDVPNASFTSPMAINSEGDIVGQYGAGGTNHGFVRNKDGGFSSFDVPGPINPGVGTQARGINDRGDIVGWFVNSAGKRRGFLLSQGQFTFIDFPGGTLTDADGINSEGDIVGHCVDANGKDHTYVLTRGGTR